MRDVPTFELAGYQKAARTVLMHPLITETYPNADALPLVRRWSAELRGDLMELFGYRLELSRTTARLLRAVDHLDVSQPARTRGQAERPFDRRRYAYLTLILAALGRAGTQIALSELADAVAADAARIDGLGLSTERAADRAAFVDAVGWLEVRGAVRLADGSARQWADDPRAGEALYDIDRDVVGAIYRPTRVLQHVRSIRSLLTSSSAHSRDTRRREAAQRVRRLLLEWPVVYYDDLDHDSRNILRGPHALADLERLTGLTAERRADGVALIDTTGGFTDRRFPGSGTVAQTALLLIGQIGRRIEDEDSPPPLRMAPPGSGHDDLARAIDAGLPAGGVLDVLAEPPDAAAIEEPDEASSHPLLEDGWLSTTMAALLDRYGTTFAAAWRADPDRLLAAALDLLAELRMVVRVDGGVLALPLLARYRRVLVDVRRRPAEPTLLDVMEGAG